MTALSSELWEIDWSLHVPFRVGGVVVEASSHAEHAPAIERRRPEPDVPEFVELGHTSELSVARALPRSELPLVFGSGHPDAPHHEREPYLVHPFV